MNLNDWLTQPGTSGRSAWLAKELGKTKSAISHWRSKGVPLSVMPHVQALTGGEVTSEAMLQHKLACAMRPKEKPKKRKNRGKVAA